MKNTKNIIGTVVLSTLLFGACQSPLSNKKENTSEFENNENEIKIGNQVWMSKNLNVDKFRNGDAIPQAKTEKEWEEAGKNKQPAWCYYDNAPFNGEKYGKLYNWYAVNDSRGLAPKGWHVPTVLEWKILVEYLGVSDAGTKMKSTSRWKQNGNGSNESGFNGIPGGTRYKSGYFDGIGNSGVWWSSSESKTDSDSFYIFELRSTAEETSISDFLDYKAQGGSVRCLKN